MSELKSDFTREDLETLIEAMGDWEALGNEEWNVMQMIKNSPMPPEDHEAFDYFRQIKEHFTRREQIINDNRVNRQEKAVFLKAKLMMVRKDMAFDQLFNMVNAEPEVAQEATSASATSESPSTSETVQKPVEAVIPGAVAVGSLPQLPPEAIEKLKSCKSTGSISSSFDLSEFFICDLGVWNHYQKYLEDLMKKSAG